MSQKHVDVKISKEALVNMLAQMLKTTHSRMLADIIIDNLSDTPVGLKQLVNGFLGVAPGVPFEIDDPVLADMAYCPTWRMDQDMTKEAGFTFQGGLKGVVKEINLKSESSVGVEITYINKDKKDKDTSVYWFPPDALKSMKEVFPETEEDDSLPF